MLLEHLKKINPKFVEFLEQEILNSEGLPIGTKIVGVETGDYIFSGGTSTSKEKALRIAIAESFERSLVEFIYNSVELAEKFMMKDFPSSSGFAAGFDNDSTKFRAICEGLERWAWSKWIDENYQIDIVQPLMKLNTLTMKMLSEFSDTLWLRKDFEITIDNKKMNLSLSIFLGFTEHGIFPGSRVSTINDDLFEHPVIEAHRNFLNSKLKSVSTIQSIDIIHKRLMYFSNHQQEALSQIRNAKRTSWPNPELCLLKNLETNIPGVFLWRCLFKNFIGWHLGNEDRFVY